MSCKIKKKRNNIRLVNKLINIINTRFFYADSNVFHYFINYFNWELCDKLLTIFHTELSHIKRVWN